MSKILSEKVGGVGGAFNKEELHLFILNHIANEVVAQVNVFNALFLYRIGG